MLSSMPCSRPRCRKIKKSIKNFSREAALRQTLFQAHRHFTPLVYSVDDMEGPEAKAACKQFDSRLSAKWGRHYSQVCGLVRSCLVFAMARATSRCLRGSWDARLKFNRPLDWISHSGVWVYSYEFQCVYASKSPFPS